MISLDLCPKIIDILYSNDKSEAKQSLLTCGYRKSIERSVSTTLLHIDINELHININELHIGINE